MYRNPEKQPTERKKPDEVAAVIADIWGVSPRFVRMVREGECKNEDIMDAIVTYEIGKQKLIDQVRQLVPVPDKKTG
jgi:hypothetical protein